MWNGTGEESKDIVANTWFDAYGNTVKQSVPYAVATGTTYRAPDLSQAATRTSYDALGRTLVITATDNTSTIYSYGVLSTTIKDALTNPTTSQSDIWGRTAAVTPPTGPGVSYTYNTLDALLQATRGGSTTSLTYDYAGQKVTMNDPDMGIWRYSYNAAGRLVGQIDAKSQLTTLAYDDLGRMTSKQAADANSSFFFDPFDMKDTNNWAWSAYQTVPFSDAGNNVVKSTGTGVDWNSSFYRSAFSLSSGKGVRMRFKVDAADTGAIFSVVANDATYRRFGAVAGSGTLWAQYCSDGVNWVTGSTLISTLETNTWYIVQIGIDDYGEFSVSAFKQDDPNVRGTYQVKMPAGKTWRFQHWIWQGNAYIDDYAEFKGTVNSYDQGTNGIGQRTGMTDLTGSAAWSYDTRGRLTSETKVVTNQGSFLTQWGYNQADLQSWIVYPGDNLGNAGEQTLVGLRYLQIVDGRRFLFRSQRHAEDHAGRLRLALTEQKDRGDDVGEFALKRPTARGSPVEFLQIFLKSIENDASVQLLLVSEVIVEGRLSDSGFFANLAGRGGGKPLLGKERRRDRPDCFPPADMLPRLLHTYRSVYTRRAEPKFTKM